MGEQSAIEWTDATWNPVRGCVKVSPGCAHCYAETFAERFRGVPGHPYAQGFDLRLVPTKLGEPQRWKQPKRIFVNSMSDLFQDGVPDDYIAEVWKTMATIRRHTYQVLTKRAERMQGLLPRLVATFGLLPNVWLGVSVENQPFADERIPPLLATPAAVRFISAEPLLGPITVRCWLKRPYQIDHAVHPALDWVILGGESGPHSRPFDLEWGRALVRECKAAGVPCFVKQLGARPTGWWTNATGPRVNRHSLRSSKGGDIEEWPEDLRVREFPTLTR